MKTRIIIVACVLLAATIVEAAPAAAQSDILLRLRSGSPAGDRFRVDSAGGVVAIGQLGIGIIPASGCGYRMMWYPFRGAFRAGTTDDGGACTYWDDANIGFYSWAGGNLTRASAFATFAFGDQVTVSGVDGAAFGASNTVSGTAGFSVGASNNCSGFTCVAMGYTTTATGQGSIAIGYRVTADANYAVALGHRASANGRSGSFTWADGSTTDSLENSANNSFQTRAAGGYRLYTNATTTTGVAIAAGGSSWTVISDRNRKQDFLAVDGEDLLASLRSVPVTKWRYIDEEDRSTWHIGPMAQDWHSAFRLGSDPLTINMSDLDGVNLAAVQALERRTTQLDEGQASMQQRMTALEAENADLKRRLERLEALLEARGQERR
ncbi:MAG TPA: tail fiber domain-containing protein [Longimicrobiales bacterium]|nr:tail fiber domain-containing protein [Longimicrobiales bacterium]